MSADVERIAREKQFWDQHHTAEMYAKWIEVPYSSWRTLACRRGPTAFLGPIEGKRVLLCGVGAEAIVFARAGAEVYGFDVSDKQIEAVNVLARRTGLENKIQVQAMPFEELDYPDEFFDLAYGNAILHHIDLVSGSQELLRVLKPGGKAVFIEPLGTNPLLNFARRYLPYRSKNRTVDERPLNFRDIEVFTRPFTRAKHTEVTLFGMLRRRVVNNRGVVAWLEAIDAAILPAFPVLGRFCAQTWIGIER
jgi:SAM-dependent methyltransferase